MNLETPICMSLWYVITKCLRGRYIRNLTISLQAQFGTREMRHQSKMNIGNTKTEVIETLRPMYIEDARTLDDVFEFC